MKESLKISKSFVCGCGREYSLELSTDLSVDNMQIEASCPACGEKRTVSMGSLMQNRSSSAQSAYQQPASSSESTPSLSFMDSMEAEASSNSSEPSSSSEPSTSSDSSGASDTLTSMEDEGDKVYTDMFGDG